MRPLAGGRPSLRTRVALALSGVLACAGVALYQRLAAELEQASERLLGP